MESAWDEGNDVMHGLSLMRVGKAMSGIAARGLEELHDHSLWLELINRR